jgi:hypothetical protein
MPASRSSWRAVGYLYCAVGERVACLALAFAVPLLAMRAAMSFSEIGRPTAAQLRAKRAALLAVAAPTLFTFLGVVLYMLHDPVPDRWLWVACWSIALTLLRSDSDAAALLAPRPVPAPLRVAHGVSALALVTVFLALHIANHLTFVAATEGPSLRKQPRQLVIEGEILADNRRHWRSCAMLPLG